MAKTYKIQKAYDFFHQDVENVWRDGTLPILGVPMRHSQVYRKYYAGKKLKDNRSARMKSKEFFRKDLLDFS